MAQGDGTTPGVDPCIVIFQPQQPQHRQTLRGKGLKARVYDEAHNVGGTWNWNRYPGARVDFPVAPYYCYTFSDELMNEFDWPERQPDQQTVLKVGFAGADYEVFGADH